MSAPTPENLDEAVRHLRTRVQKIVDAVGSRTRRTDRRRNLHLAAAGIVTALVVVSFTMLTDMAFRLDAQALTQIGRLQVEQKLPESREALTLYLKEKAPSLTSDLLWALVGALPELRPIVLRELDGKLADLASQFEDDLAESAAAAMETAREDLDARYPGLSETERIDRLVADVTEEFNRTMTGLYAELYPQYSREMRRVESYLSGLRDKDPAQLTPRERTEKELIQTLLRLVAIEGVTPALRDS
jgi:hypothetical protein